MTIPANAETVQPNAVPSGQDIEIDSQGKVTGLFELSVSYDFLGHFGSQVEKRALMSALLAVGFGIFLFSLQYIVPATVRLIRKKGGLSK